MSPSGGSRPGAAIRPGASVVSPTKIPDEWGTDYQIQVQGATPGVRTEFLTFCQDLRKRFRWTLFRYRPGDISRRDEWVIPLRVELWGDPSDVYKGDSARMGVELRPGERFEIWVAARLHDEFSSDAFRLEFVRALVTERIIEPYVVSAGILGERVIHPPDWLVHGFDELLIHRREGRPSSAYSGVLESGQILSPAEIFSLREPEELDPIDYTIFRMSSAAMVETLLDQPDGDIALREVLGELAMTDSVVPLLRKHFPAFREMEDGIEKWWVLQVASLGQQGRFDFMGQVETEALLNEALLFRFEEGETIRRKGEKTGLFEKLKNPKEEIVIEESFEGTIEDYREFVGRPGVEIKMSEAYFKLVFLKQVGFPLYRPLLDRYGAVLEKIAKRQLRGLDEELAELQQMRDAIGATLVRTADTLNHYEATQMPHRSRAFEEYRRIRDTLDKREEPVSDDRISQFLDRYERGELTLKP